jgi:hypothetical protein
MSDAVFRLTSIAIGVAVLCTPARASGQWTSSRVDGHAPIGVMGDHRHEAGEIMLSLRYMPMTMEGSRVGTASIANSEIVSATGQNFMATPTRMTMKMVMAGAMYAPTDRITLTAMLPYLDNSMDHVTRAGGAFSTASSGLGDVGLGALVGLGAWGNQSAHLNLGVSLPTGSIEAMGVLPTSNGSAVQLPYPMQLGSGTFDVKPGITWLGQQPDWSWGMQASGTLRMGENSRGWTLGNRADATAWLGVPVAHNLSFSARGALSSWGDIDGMESAASVNPSVVPTARTDLRGGTRFDAGVGVNWYAHRPSGLRFAAELLKPVYQKLHGPQLETDLVLHFGIQLVPKH